jgi:hypothetical protein
LVFVAETPTIAEVAPNQDTTPVPDMTASPPTSQELNSNAPIPNPQGSYAGANTLNDIRNAASPSVIVQLKLTSDKLKIGKDIIERVKELNPTVCIKQATETDANAFVNLFDYVEDDFNSIMNSLKEINFLQKFTREPLLLSKPNLDKEKNFVEKILKNLQ